MTTTQKMIWTLVTIVLLIGLIVFGGMLWQRFVTQEPKAHVSTEPAAQQQEQTQEEEQKQTEPKVATTGYDGSVEQGVSYNQDGVSIAFDWAQITVTPKFEGQIGPVKSLTLSPGKQFLYIATEQETDIASFIYDPASQTAHYIPSGHNVGVWLDNGYWRVENHDLFGKNPEKIVSAYRSSSKVEPWRVFRVK